MAIRKINHAVRDPIKGIQGEDDDNSYGTYVSGIAAAKDNGEGIIGTSGARLWSIKVCDAAGERKISNMKRVFNMSLNANEIDVVNRSVEMPLSPTLKRAINASIIGGITYISAGNYGHDAFTTSPASNPDAITVSSIADSDGKCGGIGPRSNQKIQLFILCIFQ